MYINGLIFQAWMNKRGDSTFTTNVQIDRAILYAAGFRLRVDRLGYLLFNARRKALTENHDSINFMGIGPHACSDWWSIQTQNPRFIIRDVVFRAIVCVVKARLLRFDRNKLWRVQR